MSVDHKLSELKIKNRELKQNIDHLALEILKLKSKGSQKQKTEVVVNNSVGFQNDYPQPFPVVLTPEAGLVSKLIYPTKKIAYSYAVYGIKETLRKIKRKLVNK